MFTSATKFLSTMQERLNPLREAAPCESTRLAGIRHAMLDCLGPEVRTRHPQLEQRILLAANVPALWFMRPELLMVLAAQRGEQAAREMVDEITVLFQGLLPKSLSQRPSALQR